MFGNSWRIGSVAGIEIKVDASWAIIAVLIGVSLFARFELLHDELDAGPLTALAAGATLLFFASVLFHELAHSLMAKARGIPVRGITLFLFGGATEAKVESRQPKDEFLITVVGPASSVVLAAVFWGLATAAGPAQDPIPDALGYLAWINLALAVFNLLPGLPLDGGRVLRSAVWAFTGNISRATRIAARAGQILGYGLIALGIVAVIAGGLGGLWLAAIGWFLAQAAQASYVQQQLDHLLRGVDTGDVMSQNLVTVPPDISIDEAVHRYFLVHDHSAFPVADGDGGTAGLITLRGVRRVPKDERATTTVGDCMVPLERASTVSPDRPLKDVVERFQTDDVQRVLVVDDGTVVGIVTPRDIGRWMQLAEELDREPARS